MAEMTSWKNVFNGHLFKKGTTIYDAQKVLMQNTYFQYMIWCGRVYEVISLRDTGFTERDMK